MSKKNHDSSSLIFQLKSKSQYTFKIHANGGIGEGKISDFCNKDKCKIPLIFGGRQTFLLYKNSKEIYKKEIDAGENRFYCFYGKDWNRRICRFRDICFDDKNLTFISPYKIISDTPFLVLGGRPPPYDKKRDRIFSLNVNISSEKDENGNFITIPKGRQIHEGITHYASTYYNMHMLWHTLFDFLLPLFYTFTITKNYNQKNSLESNQENYQKERNVIIPRDALKPTSDFVQSVTNTFKKVDHNHCYKDLIVGISKVKDETGMFYEFPNNFTYLLHPYIFEKFKINSSLPENPVILFSGRKTSKRTLTNYDELFEKLKNEFGSQFEVQSIFYEEHSMPQQIEKTYKSTIMIGIHGSGLSHVTWMRPGTVMVEIFPYKFECRDWYEKATSVSAVKYFKYVPKDESESPNPSEQAKSCWNVAKGCEGNCLDALRDQNIQPNPERFIEVIKKAIQSVKDI